MKVRFWGVRGSLPAPLLPGEVREKIEAVLRLAVPADFTDEASRRAFTAGLPPWLYGTTGSNTPCVSVTLDGFEEPLVFDCGSGIRGLGRCAGLRCSGRWHVFLSHFHWDHLHGLPFFAPLFDPAANIDFYSPVPGFQAHVSSLMSDPHYPVRLEETASAKRFIRLDSPVAVGPATVSFRKMSHPGDTFAYCVNHEGSRFVYATDAELSRSDFDGDGGAFFSGVDVAVVDAQYTLEEAVEKQSWGHSSFGTVVEFAVNWGIRHLVLFHHDPGSCDRKLHEMLESARRYVRLAFDGRVEVSLAREGTEIVL